MADEPERFLMFRVDPKRVAFLRRQASFSLGIPKYSVKLYRGTVMR